MNYGIRYKDWSCQNQKIPTGYLAEVSDNVLSRILSQPEIEKECKLFTAKEALDDSDCDVTVGTISMFPSRLNNSGYSLVGPIYYETMAVVTRASPTTDQPFAFYYFPWSLKTWASAIGVVASCWVLYALILPCLHLSEGVKNSVDYIDDPVDIERNNDPLNHQNYGLIRDDKNPFDGCECGNFFSIALNHLSEAGKLVLGLKRSELGGWWNGFLGIAVLVVLGFIIIGYVRVFLRFILLVRNLFS